MLSRSSLIPVAVLLLVTAVAIGAWSDQQSANGPSGAIVTLETYDIETGEPVTGACFSLEGANNGACDGNGGGSMTFAQPIPPGTYEVGYERTADGSHHAVGNFPLIVTDDSDVTMRVAFVKVEDGPNQWDPSRGEITLVPVSITSATPSATATSGSDTCFVLHGASVEGIHVDMSFCERDLGPKAARSGTYLLTSETCDVANTGIWIAVTGDATIEDPLLANGCIAD